MTTYNTCTINRQTVECAFDLCIHNDGFRAGSACKTRALLTDVTKNIKEMEEDIYPFPWHVEKTITSNNGVMVVFENGSVLDIFVATQSARGKRFHCLQVDEGIDERIQNTVLRRLIRPFQDRDAEDEGFEDLLEFAERMLNQPLLRWHKDMLKCLYTMKKYIVPPMADKEEANNLCSSYNEYLSNELEIRNKRKPTVVSYTYDELMTGKPFNGDESNCHLIGDQ